MTFVQPGSAVRQLVWEAVPDKYAAPRVYASQTDAQAYANETGGRIQLLVSFPEGNVRLGPPPATPIAPGDVVRRVAYRLQPWGERPLEFDELESARIAAPIGRSTGIFQILWIGPHEVRLVGETEYVNKEEPR